MTVSEKNQRAAVPHQFGIERPVRIRTTFLSKLVRDSPRGSKNGETVSLHGNPRERVPADPHNRSILETW